MGRARKNPDDKKLPGRVYRGKTKFEFHPSSGGSISLCPLNAQLSDVWAAYEMEVQRLSDPHTFSALVEQFLHSADFLDLAIDTQKDYNKYSKKILPVFGTMHPDNIRPEHIRKYMDKRGEKAKTQANREKTFMSRVFRWGYERGRVKLNPCSGVMKFKEASRDRYIEDTEYMAVYNSAPDAVRVAMELSYLCCARQKDILELQKNQLRGNGIFIQQGKTGKKQIKAWSPRLRAAIAMADSLPLKVGMLSVYVVHQATGARYTRDGFNSAWRNAKLAAQKKHPDLDLNFTFHDLKAKGISDLEGTPVEKQFVSGHKTLSQVAVYDRKVPVVPTVDAQILSKNGEG